jgi:hypothetical protein
VKFDFLGVEVQQNYSKSEYPGVNSFKDNDTIRILTDRFLISPGQSHGAPARISRYVLPVKIVNPADCLCVADLAQVDLGGRKVRMA